MTSEQLLATRATLWRQKAEPLLTFDDAQSWLLQSGLCLFLPRKAQIPAPAPSFVEACLGETSATPPRAAIETAQNLLARLIESGTALPLNLLGTPSDHPDFLVGLEALPFVYALRGDRDWKHAPGTAGANRVSPLITEVWKLLERRGVLTTIEIQAELGRELTQAAILRALHELWASLRVVPLYQADGQETLWEPLQSRHQKAMNSGVGMSQVTALSVLVSVYLQSVVAATGEDAESFLSPLASRSKVREVVRGLTATRQLALIQMETQSLLYVEGSLPEFPEAEKPEPKESVAAARPGRRPHPTSPEGLEAALARKVAGSAPRPAYQRPSATTDARPRPPARRGGDFRPAAGAGVGSRKREGSSGSYRSAADGSRPSFRPTSFKGKSAPPERSEPGTGLRADGTPKKTRWRDMPGGRPDQKGKPARFGPRKADGATGEKSSRPMPRREPGTVRPAAGPRPAYKQTSESSGGKPFRPAGAGRAATTGRPSGGLRPARGPARPGRFAEGRPSYSGSKGRLGSGQSGTGATGRPPSRAAAGGTRPPSRPTDGRSGSRPPSRPGSGRYVARPEGSRPFSRPRRDDLPAGEGKFTPRPPKPGGFSPARPRSAESQPYSPRSGGPAASGRPSTGRPPFGRPAAGRPSSGFGGGKKAGGSSLKPDYKPRSGKPRSGKPRSGKLGSGKPGGASGPRPASRPGFGQGPKPGGSRSGPVAGRPRRRPASKPAGRPPSKFKKRPE